MSVLGQMIKKIRTKKGITQSEISGALGFSTVQFVSNWERGQSEAPAYHIKKIARVLDVDPDILLRAKLKDATTNIIKEYEAGK